MISHHNDVHSLLRQVDYTFLNRIVAIKIVFAQRKAITLHREAPGIKIMKIERIFLFTLLIANKLNR